MRKAPERTAFIAIAAAILLSVTALEPASVAWGEAVSTECGNSFNYEWRTVLKGKAARNLATHFGGTAASAPISVGELDALEEKLFDALANDLKPEPFDREHWLQELPEDIRELNRVPPGAECASDYYRQYATRRWERHPVIIVNGFHRDHLRHCTLAVAADARCEVRWKAEEVAVSDGGTHYWNALYLRDLRKFVRFRDDATGSPLRTILFHGLP